MNQRYSPLSPSPHPMGRGQGEGYPFVRKYMVPTAVSILNFSLPMNERPFPSRPSEICNL